MSAKRARPLQGDRRRQASAVSARWLAFRAVRAFEQRGAFVSHVLDVDFQERNVPSRDRAFATELASECVRRKRTIETVLERYVTRPRQEVEDEIWTLLQLGCCQLLFLSQVPPHAAVDETVKLCGTLRKPRARGFVNGILRNIERETNTRPESPSTPAASIPAREDDSLDALQGTLKASSSALLPILDPRNFQASLRFVEFSRPIFASPQEKPMEYIAQTASQPFWLLDRWASSAARQAEPSTPEANAEPRVLPDPLDALLATALYLATSGRMSLRVNLRQTNRERLLEVLHTAGVEAQPGSAPEAVRLAGSVTVKDLPGFREGWFSVQDESAMAAVDLLAPRPGESVLDLCAAPGGKTTHIAERLGGEGTVVACDISAARLETVTENARRLRLEHVETRLISPDGRDIPAGPFQAVLVDVPCSNTGVLGKRPEARWRLSPESFAELIPLQRRLLHDALARTATGGRVVYSTCSIDPAENDGVVQTVLAEHPEFRLAEERRHHPGHPSDGGYQALLIREHQSG
jgi:16S rRNA (cytosine967-C5)-methyltransferase